MKNIQNRKLLKVINLNKLCKHGKDYSYGITLITLVITIVLLLILAGITINLSLGQNGIFNRAQQAKENYSQSAAREKLETVLMEATIEKETNSSYNNHEFLDNMLEENGITVNGDNVIVDNYNFIIDRDKLKIVHLVGETNIKITKEVKKYLGKNLNNKYEVEVLVILESNKELKNTKIEKADGAIIELSTEELFLGKTITMELDEEYKVIVTTTEGKEETRKIIEKSEETIKNAKELAEFRDKVNNGLTYEGKIMTLTQDLDLRNVCNKENPWIPIGGFNLSVEGIYNAFSGTFNGNNHTIDYLYINTDSEISQGLFGYTLNASITGMIIGENSSINAVRCTGAVVGYAMNSTISYCGNNGNVTIQRDSVGGIVGVLDGGKIIACYNKRRNNRKCKYSWNMWR